MGRRDRTRWHPVEEMTQEQVIDELLKLREVVDSTIDSAHIGSLREALSLRSSEAKSALLLYRAKGGWVSTRLLRMCGYKYGASESYESVRQYIFRIRRALGEGTVLRLSGLDRGDGMYKLTQVGLQKIKEILGEDENEPGSVRNMANPPANTEGASPGPSKG